MASAVNVGMKQTRGYFVPLGNCDNKIYSLAGASGAGGSFLPGGFTTASWTSGGGSSAGAVLSSISSIGQGGLLRDMGKTVVSSNRTFRKVQNTLASGPALPNVATPLLGLPFYIELNTGQNLSSAGTQVAYLPGLM